MKCNVCGVEVNSRGKRCPLCGNPLEGKPKQYAFPVIKRKKNTLLKLLLLFSLIALLITGYINYQISGEFTWTKYVLLGLISNYLIIYYMTNSYKDIFKLLGRYGFILIAICVIWYFYTRWSLFPNYVIPGLCIVELLFADIVALIIKRKRMKKYLNVILSNVVLGLVPFMLLVFDIVTLDFVCHASILLSVVNILSVVIFDFHDLKDELLIIFNY